MCVCVRGRFIRSTLRREEPYWHRYIAGNGCIYVHPGKQKVVSCSSTEAELIGLSEGGGIIIWARDCVLNQGYVVGPAIVY